jgi:GTP-binding protein YchF
MDLGIIGLAQSGKTTVFNAVTGGHAQTGVYGAGVEPNIGVVKVPDERLDRLCAVLKPKKVTHADVRYLDFPGAAAFGRGGGPAARFLASLAQCDALIHVVRAFTNESVPHPEGSIDPHRDIGSMDMELSFADQGFIERRLERLETEVRSMRAGEREAGEKEIALLQRLKEGLEGETPLRAQPISEDEARMLANYQFLTDKPLLLVLNIDEADVGEAAKMEEEFRGRWGGPHVEVAALCGELEMELSELSEEDAAAFRADMGLSESSLDRMIRLSYELLGLISFFTVNPEEGRAWTIRRGTPAVVAAGKVHSDMERGFIRAEVVGWEELMESGSLAEARKRGIVRTEGKGYPAQDGEVLHILFNV